MFVSDKDAIDTWGRMTYVIGDAVQNMWVSRQSIEACNDVSRVYGTVIKTGGHVDHKGQFVVKAEIYQLVDKVLLCTLTFVLY